jgi:replicative DNA helicase
MAEKDSQNDSNSGYSSGSSGPAKNEFRNRNDFRPKKRDVGTLLGRELPSSLDAEKAVLAAILLNENNLPAVSEILITDDFYGKSNQIIFRAISELSREGKKCDLVVLHDLLTSQGKIEECGGVDYLLELQEQVPAVGLAEQHAKIIKDKSMLRGLITTSSEVIGSCYDQKGRSVDLVLDMAEKNIFAVSNKITSKNFVPIGDLLKTTFKKLSEMGQRDGHLTGISSGFTRFDEMTSGMQNGDLLILAARPSMGKTSLALNMAMNSWKHGASVGIFSLEMSSEQLVLRLISSESGIPHQKIRNANITSEEWVELTNAAAKLDDAGVYIDDSPSLTIMELRAKARRLKSRHNIDLLVIDYLQLISGGERQENRTQEISLISRSLKALAKELDIPVLALSQLSRSLESRLDKRPMLSDLRESGAIEQDGDVIFFIYRDVVYHPDTEHPDVSEVIIGKQRNGPTGSFHVTFEGATTTFHDIPDSDTFSSE